MSIMETINELHNFVEANKDNDGGKKRARDIKMLAVTAIRYGMKSRDWQEYMKEFAKEGESVNPLKLKRLIGEDEAFNKTEWSYETLAYIAANATCDVTTTVGTGNGLTTDMKNNLDDGFAPPIAA
ncbi:MAG: hypothetical protein ABJA66_03330 [Actinomycetota bacterium]